MLFPGESQGRQSLWAAVYGAAQSQTPLKQLSSSSSPIYTFLDSGSGSHGDRAQNAAGAERAEEAAGAPRGKELQKNSI